MKIIDAHCDVLLKLMEDPELNFYVSSPELHVNYDFMNQADVAVQIFALFVPPMVPSSHRFNYVIKLIDIFYEQVVKPEHLIPVYDSKQLDFILQSPTKTRGGILSLEGADALEGNITYLRTLYRLGLRALGFTWNHRNEAADGVEEPNPGGLSKFGRQVLAEANRLGILLDISHLSTRGFWDVIELSSTPIIASHSNCMSIHKHPRNLTDEQLKAIMEKNGVVGLTFVPCFVSGSTEVFIDDLLKHLEHVLALGGDNHVAFGSDFDGIRVTMGDLKNLSCYVLLTEALLKRYSEDQVKKWMHGNWLRILKQVMGENGVR